MDSKRKLMWKGFKPRTSFDRVRQRRRRALLAKPYHSISTRAGLKNELHRVTSLIVRLRDGCCVICRTTEDLQAGHFYKRGYLEITYDLRNVNAQCGFHNKLHNDDPFPYMNYMQKTYGPDVVCELNELRMKKRCVPDSELRDLLDSHRQLLSTMRKAA